MIDILKKMNEDFGEEDIGELLDNEDEVDSDDDDQVDLHERIKNINLNNADDVWNALTADERNEFEALLNKGMFLSMIPHHNVLTALNVFIVLLITFL